MWAYLIVFDDKIGTREEVQAVLDSMDDVGFWHSCLPNCIFFSCSLAAKGISKEIVKKFGDPKIRKYRFLVAEVHNDRQGYLPGKVWKLFKDPESYNNGESL